ncbi:hypothetical protein D9613_008202 [Agrocybe pediades]|uniref:Uncharacterized protein n=1 Tax=Agrocybe pediades TaxID=84607 RepID=A0A8H4VKE9_9AGAR|nr:hypothetical protein D9613_008202 [Agrocybe pediades]
MVRHTRAWEYADRKCELEGIKLHLCLSPSSCSFAPAPNKKELHLINPSFNLWVTPAAKSLRTRSHLMMLHSAVTNKAYERFIEFIMGDDVFAMDTR